MLDYKKIFRSASIQTCPCQSRYPYSSNGMSIFWMEASHKMQLLLFCSFFLAAHSHKGNHKKAQHEKCGNRQTCCIEVY